MHALRVQGIRHCPQESTGVHVQVRLYLTIEECVHWIR